MECDSPVGDGRARLTGALPGHGASPNLTLELDRVPAQVALDTLRTVRSGLDPTLQAAGTISGKISYAAQEVAAPVPFGRPVARSSKSHAPLPGPLSGSITIAGLQIRGDGLSRPILVPKVAEDPAPGQAPALVAAVTVPLGAPSALNVTARLALDGYQIGIRGGAALPRLRELAHMSGLAHATALDKLDGGPATLDMTSSGPWLRPPSSPLPELAAGAGESPAPARVLMADASDRINGTVMFHGVSWKPDFLANPVEVASATLRFDETGAGWGPVAFSYGPVRGAATIKLPAGCPATDKCSPQFTAEFGSLDAADLEAALLGVRELGTLLSSVLARLRPGSARGWPEIEGTVHAAFLVLGPVSLRDASASIHIQPEGVDLQSLDGVLLGGRIHARGSITPGEKPNYKLEGRFDQVNPADLGRLLGMTWSGSSIDGSGKVELAGFTESDLAASARGSLHFDWGHGAIAMKDDADAPPALARFDRWTADADIADGSITLKQNQVRQGAKTRVIEGSATFGDSPRVTFGAHEETSVSANKQVKP